MRTLLNRTERLSLVSPSWTKNAVLCLLLVFTSISYISAQPCAGIKCISNVNLSLDENCEATLTPAMFLTEMTHDASEYVIEAYDDHGNLVDFNFDIEDIDQNYTVNVFLPVCNNISCWSDLFVEYKLPPQIDCPDDLTLSCGALDVLGLPAATAGCGSVNFNVTLHNEIREALTCDPDYTHRVTRTYRATDEFGNFVECSHEVLLERVDLSAVMFPESRSVASGNAISCGDPGLIFDENGVPLPWLYQGVLTGSGSGVVLTGSGSSGVPFICDDSTINGVFCPLTGSGSGAPLIPNGGATTVDADGNVIVVPGEVNQICNSAVFYTDLEIPGTGCIKKIMRTWEVREWWCNGENSVGGVQLIEIVDDVAPTFICPADFSVSTNDDCAGSVQLPSIDATDACDNGINVVVDYPNGFLLSNGGEAELEVGNNVVTYIVSDDCTNSSSCSINVTVRDATEPVTICDQNTVVSISQTGNTIVYASTFDDGSWDECGLDRIEVRRMDSLCVAADTLFGETVTFCCEDVTNEVMVVLRAYDLGGNFNECMVNVDVQDKVVAQMTCPPDVTIDCREGYDLNNLSVTFGSPDIIDNCASTQIVNETPTADVNQCGIGEISRLFELMDEQGVNVLRSCKQRVEIINTTPFVASNIQWPLDYEAFNQCGVEDLGPEDLPELNGFPIILAGDDECSLLGWDYEDEVFVSTVGFGECLEIRRTWTVLNWCSQVNGQFERYVIPTPQIITLRNTNAPSIDPMDDVTIESINIDCESGLISLERTGQDDCPNGLSWTYEVRNEMDVVVASGDTSVYVDTLTAGEYMIDWVLSDGCGNRDLDTQELTVLNLKAPQPVCLNGLSVNLDPVTDGMGTIVSGSVELWAEDFDAGSLQPCGNGITLSMASDTTVKNITFDCTDLGVQQVQLWVTDVVTGAQDFCVTNILIEDNDSYCPTMSNRVDVRGEIYTETFEEISGVEVSLDGDLRYETGTDGYYAFNNMPQGGDYMVQAKKDIDYLNGVSTLDLVMIQRHILGIEKLDSPYKQIAADVDGNGSISALDLIELRKLILGVYDELPNNTSWRFIDEEYQFLDPQNAFVMPIAEEYEILNLNEDMDIDFIGVKVGDVNESVTANLNNNPIEDRNSSVPLNFVIEEQMLQAGNIYTLDVRSNNYYDVNGWQGTMKFDPEIISVRSVQGGAIDLEDSNINLGQADKGVFTFSYHTRQNVTIDDEATLYSITIEVKENISTTELFTINSDVTKAESYNDFSNIAGVNIVTDELASGVAITSVSPNPWIDKTTIEFEMDNDGKASFEFYDVNGRLLNQISGNYNRGVNTLDLRKADFNYYGVIYVRLTSDNATAEHKMLLMK